MNSGNQETPLSTGNNITEWFMKRLSKKSGFTLIEALLVIAIIAVMSSMSLMVLADAANSAKISRAKVQIRKINDLIMDRWEEFQSRPLPFRSPIRFPPLCGTKNNGRIRLYALRELMRLEMPDRYTDILSGAQEIPFELYDANGNLVDPHPAPMVPQFFNVGSNSLHDFYMRQLTPNCSPAHQGAECLYLILLSIQDEYGNGLDAFSDSEIGDVDNDGMKEILDPWGTPISWLRWAPGLSEPVSKFTPFWTAPPTFPTTGFTSPVQSGIAETDPDPFDPHMTDMRLDPNDTNPADNTFRLVPLIYSAGPDREYDIWRRDETDFDFHNFGSGLTLINYTDVNTMIYLNDPYAGLGLADDDTPSVGFRIDCSGSATDLSQLNQPNGIEGYFDNIDNHFGFEE